MKKYEVIKEVFNPCGGTQLQLDNPALYVQDQYRHERSIEFLATEHNGSTVIEALLEGGRKHRYTFSELPNQL